MTHCIHNTIARCVRCQRDDDENGTALRELRRRSDEARRLQREAFEASHQQCFAELATGYDQSIVLIENWLGGPVSLVAKMNACGERT
jgi:hypothetical protein